MRAPYGLEIIENCLSCPHRQDRLSCNLSPPAVESLSAITSAAVYPKGATLFVEGRSPRGVFVPCSGRVKLSTSSADGRTLILRISESGDLLGLPATVTGRPYECEKLTRFLLDLCSDHTGVEGDIKLTLTLTDEEVAQIIGASRETVTRLFSDFKKKQLVQVKGSTVTIKNKPALESLVAA